MASRLFRFSVRAAALVACALTIPQRVCGCGIAALYADDLDAGERLARGVAASITPDLGTASFHTGSPRFDGEWAFGTYSMATMGLGQMVLLHPELRDTEVPLMEACADQLVSPATNAFGTEAWGSSGLEGLPGGKGHGYLGYANLALGMLRLLSPRTRHAALHDRLTEALARRMKGSPHGLFETYPGEAYPSDMSMVAASIALHDCATGTPERPWFPAWRAGFSRWIDPASGLAHQAAVASLGRPAGPPRSSGTALAAYALSFVDEGLSRRLYEGLSRARGSALGFGYVREYPAGQEGAGDIDSGPVVFGAGVSATGFSIAAAKLHGDEEMFASLHRTAALFGVPVEGLSRGRRYMSGGPLGNAILFAMSTATFAWRGHCKRGGGQ